MCRLRIEFSYLIYFVLSCYVDFLYAVIVLGRRACLPQTERKITTFSAILQAL